MVFSCVFHLFLLILFRSFFPAFSKAEEKEKVKLAETVALCLKEEFIVESEVRQVFVNGDRLFSAQAAQEEVREQVGDLEYLELAEAKVGDGLATLAQFAKWTDQAFPGFVKMWGCVVENRDVSVKESKVIGVIYTKAGDTLESHLQKQELRNDHRMYLALTAFQAWKHSLYTTPCLSVFTMENLVVIADAEAPGGYRSQIRIQFPSAKYLETMGTETLDTNVLQLADVSLGWSFETLESYEIHEKDGWVFKRLFSVNNGRRGKAKASDFVWFCKVA